MFELGLQWGGNSDMEVGFETFLEVDIMKTSSFVDLKRNPHSVTRTNTSPFSAYSAFNPILARHIKWKELFRCGRKTVGVRRSR